MRRGIRSDEHQRPANRRPGIFPGRRFVLALAIAASLLGSSGPRARADDSSEPIVVATVYSSSGTSNETATLSALQQCPTYSGPSTMQELGRNGFVPVTFPPNVWALSTILGCLEPKPVSLVGQGGVTVLGIDGTPQSDSGSQLTAADLAAPGSTDFNNPQEAPVVSNLGTAIRYDRPWRGASQGQTDDDYLDQVTESLNGQAQPLTIEVFEGQLLSVTIHASDTTVQAGSSVRFSATTSGQGASTLAYSWTFDGAAPSSTSPNPQVTFADQGQYNVTVQVTDTAGGGGVASLPITVGTPSAPSTGGHKQKGAGTNKKSHAPTGPKKSGGHHAGGPAGKPKSGQSTTPAKTNTNTTGGTTTQPSTTAQTTPTTTTPTTTTPTTTGTTPHPSTAPRTPRTHPPAPLTRPSTPVPFAGPRVTGQLISDVTTIPAADSPLVRIVPAAVATAPPARRAIRASLLPAFGAGLAVILLLGLGARRELRTRRAWRTLRFGS